MNFKHGIYSVRELLPGLYRIENSHVFMDLIVGTHHALLWDTGYGYADLNEVVRQITPLPFYVVNSHGHVDHTCGNWQFPEIFIHPKDMDLCRQHNSPQVRAVELASAELPDEFDHKLHLNRGHGCLSPVQESHVFDLGGKSLEVIELPGHTAGSIGLLYREERIFYMGDAANNFVWLFLPEAQNIQTYRKTLLKLISMDFDRMIHSHCPEILPKKRIQYYLDLVENLNFDTGEIVPPPIDTGIEARICIRGGMSLDDREKEDFAAILIGKDKVNL